jgi:hypothetical protein
MLRASLLAYGYFLPIMVARSNTGIVGSNTTRGMDVCLRLFYVCVVLCVGSDLAAADPPFKESYRLCTGSRNLKIGQGPSKGCTAIIQFNSVQLFIIYVPSQQPQDQLQIQHSVDTGNYIMDKHNIKSKSNYKQVLCFGHYPSSCLYLKTVLFLFQNWRINTLMQRSKQKQSNNNNNNNNNLYFLFSLFSQ